MVVSYSLNHYKENKDYKVIVNIEDKVKKLTF